MRRIWREGDFVKKPNFSETFSGFIASMGKNRELLETPEETLAELIVAHGKRVAILSHAIALELGLSPVAAGAIAEAAFNHDAGKVFLDEAILLQPGPLSVSQRAAIHLHTVFGNRLACLLGRGRCSNPVVVGTVCRSHHERWDGSGYPDGLAKEAIPLAARIVAVADSYDALVSKRPYKDGWMMAKAISHIVSLSGKHFDPKVITAFEAVVYLARADPANLELRRAEVLARKFYFDAVAYAEASGESLSGQSNGAWRRLRQSIPPRIISIRGRSITATIPTRISQPACS